jgi:hypothetical protein
MEIKANVYFIHSWNDIEQIVATITEQNYKLARANQELQYQKIVNVFKRLKKEGQINSIFKPKNRKIQKEIDELIKTKRNIKKTINQLKDMFS